MDTRRGIYYLLWQMKIEGTSFPIFTFDENTTAHPFHQMLCDRKSQSGAFYRIVSLQIRSFKFIEDFGKLLSPLYGIRENNCPVVLIHGKADSVVEPFHSTAFYRRMREVGAQCQLHWIEETNHAFLLAEYTSNLAACKVGIRIIDQYL